MNSLLTPNGLKEMREKGGKGPEKEYALEVLDMRQIGKEGDRKMRLKLTDGDSKMIAVMNL